MEEEIWKDVKNYEGFYQVSNLGKVRSLTRRVNRSRGGTQISRGKILKPGNGKANKYWSVTFSKYGIMKTFYVHSLVADAFLPEEKPNCFVVDHINNNIDDNRAENLRYCSQRENLNSRSLVSQTGYVGVSFNTDSYIKKYRARIRINGKMKELGSYHTAKEAGEAYINAKNQLEK